MKRKLKITFGNKVVSIAMLFLVVFGSLMIASAEMGNDVGNTSYITSVIGEQLVFVGLGLALYFLCMNIHAYKISLRLYEIAYFGVLALLVACRFFGSINGAYAWIRLGPASFQPSEIAKIFMIIFAGKMLGIDRGEKNLAYFKQYALAALLYVLIIVVYQSDLGSGMVLFTVCFCMAYVPVYKELKNAQKIMFFCFLIALAGIAFIMSDFCTNILKKMGDSYKVARFLAAADPFSYRYDNGYHVVMSLISLANGNIFGLGYGNSIHKYMNFPNPSNDFILAVLIEELGIIGFVALLLGYGFMLGPIIRQSLKSKFISSKIVLIGVFLYFAVHFVFNVGGVSGFIPLTGVPLLLISSGGSSLMASLMALGFAQGELSRNKIAQRQEENNKQ